MTAADSYTNTPNHTPTPGDWPSLAAALTRDLAEPLAEEERHRRLLTAMQHLIPFDAAAVLRLDGDTLLPLAAVGLSDDVLGRRFAVAEHPRLARILASRAPLRFDAHSPLPDPYDGLIEDSPGLLPVHDCMGVRLHLGDRPWGVLTLDALAPDAFASIAPDVLPRLVEWVEACVQAAQTVAGLREQSQREQLVQQSRHAERASRALLGKSAAMLALREEISTVAASDLTVLILGETGVGKELVAERLHADSLRRAAPLVQINCAALPENLAESELFGHRKGAFTGALQDRIGKFELAHQGTLFLDEVGELPLAIQAKLLRVLQSGEVQRPGSDRPVRVDVRVLAATNRDLRDEVARGRFRADLYHRLSVYPLRVPPLRERGRDVLSLAGAFFEENQRRLGVRHLRLSSPAKEALLAHTWLGNVRELEHAISRAALRALARQGREARWVVIDAAELGLDDQRPAASASTAELGAGARNVRADLSLDQALDPALHSPLDPAPEPSQGLREATDHFQRAWLLQTLARHAGNQAAAAREAGMHRSNFARLLKRLGIDARA